MSPLNRENPEGAKARKGEEEGFTFDELSGRVIGAAIQVHRTLGPGFLEAVYERALKVELAKRGIPFEAQKEVPVLYDGKIVGTHVLDLFVANELIVELKAVDALADIHFVQVKSYLKATGKPVGLLMNFNDCVLITKRVVRKYEDGESQEE